MTAPTPKQRVYLYHGLRVVVSEDGGDKITVEDAAEFASWVLDDSYYRYPLISEAVECGTEEVQS
jgi:hypothetical protein